MKGEHLNGIRSMLHPQNKPLRMLVCGSVAGLENKQSGFKAMKSHRPGRRLEALN